MHEAAKDLRFEYAARLRDEVVDLRKELKALRASRGRGVTALDPGHASRGSGRVGSSTTRRSSATAGGSRTRGPARRSATPMKSVVVDGFLMPAVADRHVHIELSDPAAVLRGGVTAVRDLAWPPDRIFPLADASEMPSYNGPLIRAAGPMLTGHGGYPTAAALGARGNRPRAGRSR